MRVRCSGDGRTPAQSPSVVPAKTPTLSTTLPIWNIELNESGSAAKDTSPWRPMKMTLCSDPNRCALVLGAAAVCALLSLLAPARAAEGAKPNVIVILADDQGSVDAGCYGAKDLVTPGVDALAARGVRFTQFYSAAPVCSPSRASLLTGRYPWLAGMPNNGAAPPKEADDQLDTLTGEGLPASERTLADMFRAAGYATAHLGKWHLGS